MSARASRRAAQFDFSSLSPIECLLIAQAAYEYGAATSSWSTASKLMAKHPLLSRPKNFFAPTLCASIYEHLMKEANLERTEAASAPKAPENLALAQKHFQIRFDELVTMIQAEESKFKTVMQEIEEIKAGQWDDGQPAKPSGAKSSSADEEMDEESKNTDAEGENAASEEPEDGDADAEGQMEEEEEEEEEKGQEEEELDTKSSHSREDKSNAAGEEEDSAAHSDEEQRKNAHGESSDDEPLQTVRRSTRRKSSVAAAAPPPLPSSSRNKGKRQRAVKEEPESAGSEQEDEASRQEAEAEEEAPSSPYGIRSRDGKRKATFSDEATRDTKRAREGSVLQEDDEAVSHSTRAAAAAATRPGRRAAAPLSSASTSGDNQLPNKKFQNVIGLLHQQISTHRNGTIFHNPIKLSDAPDYHDIVKRPMDLKTMKARVKDGAISNSLEFQRDVYLMFANAMMYNRPGSDVYTMTEDMMMDSELAIKNHKQTEGFRAQR